MTPTAQITTNAINTKACGTFAKGKMLLALDRMTKLNGIPHELETNFERAYRAIDEVSSLPVDTDPAKNADLDTDDYQLKANNAITKTAEFKVKLDSLKADKGEEGNLLEVKKLTDDAIKLIMDARDYVGQLVGNKATIDQRKDQDAGVGEA